MTLKEFFKESINKIIEQYDWISKAYSIGIDIFHLEDKDASCYLEACLRYLCKDSDNTIGWFLWETNAGKCANRLFITEADGTEIHLYCVDDLWNYLVKNNPDIEDIIMPEVI